MRLNNCRKECGAGIIILSIILLNFTHIYAQKIYIPTTKAEVDAYWEIETIILSQENDINEKKRIKSKVYTNLMKTYISMLMREINSEEQVVSLFIFIRLSDAAAEEFSDYLPDLLIKKPTLVKKSLKNMDEETEKFAVLTIQDIGRDDNTGLIKKYYTGLFK